MNDKTSFLSALRPFSLIVAVATCGLGTSLAVIEGHSSEWLALLVMVGGIVLQSSVNLINDHRDIELPHFTEQQRLAIRRNTRIGFGLMFVSLLIAVYLSSVRGWPLFLLCLLGLVGAWGYTGGPVNYKQRGLGIIMVFFFMGVLLIGGSYYVVSGEYHWNILWISLPFSLLSSLLLLSNELRDHEEDTANNIKTLSVRFGYPFGVKLYYTLVATTYFITALLYFMGLISSFLFILLTLIALWHPLKLLNAPMPQRRQLTPLTGRLYLVFSLAFLTTLWIPQL